MPRTRVDPQPVPPLGLMKSDTTGSQNAVSAGTTRMLLPVMAHGLDAAETAGGAAHRRSITTVGFGDKKKMPLVGFPAVSQEKKKKKLFVSCPSP